MPKVLKCGDVMSGCTAVLEGRDDAELMKKVADHAKIAHGMGTITPDVMNKVKAAIKTKL